MPQSLAQSCPSESSLNGKRTLRATLKKFRLFKVALKLRPLFFRTCKFCEKLKNTTQPRLQAVSLVLGRRATPALLVARGLVARRSHAHLFCVLPHGFPSKRETALSLGSVDTLSIKPNALRKVNLVFVGFVAVLFRSL